MPSLTSYLRRALALPPHVAARKAAALAVRKARGARDRLRDRMLPTYGPPPEGPFSLSLYGFKPDFTIPDTQALSLMTTRHLSHRFDLLGSTPVDAGYGGETRGLEGIRFPAPPAIAQIAVSRDPWRLVPRPCRARARRIYALIDDPAYQPIDWQRDLRSGYRWSNTTPWDRLEIGTVRGADIKLPWELSRMQHLPQLALAAFLARNGDPSFQPAQVYAREIRNQILDFLASNPPRFGACWGCPMDVAIRAANWVLAVALLEQADIRPDEQFRKELLTGLRDAAAFVARNLEWSEAGRSNHYLSDLTGLLFAASALPRSARTRTWINFATRQLASEVVVQFHKDGGNYEGSTAYHRLSAELAAYGLALAAGLVRDEPEIFRYRDRKTLRMMRPVPTDFDAPIGRLLDLAGERLPRMLAFTRAIRRPDADIVQIGDTDSGRLFKLAPERDPAAPDEFEEAELRVNELIDALSTLTSGAGTGPAGHIIQALARGQTVGNWAEIGHAAQPAKAGPSSMATPADTAGLASSEQLSVDDALDELKARLAALPDAARRTYQFALQQPLAEEPELACFSDFGLYLLRAPGFFLSFRCAGHMRTDAPTGHTHDDNLAVELYCDGEPVITDPGTFVYTPLPEWRNAYRISTAHFVPRAAEIPTVRLSSYLFHVKHLQTARCLIHTPNILAGVLEGGGGRILRVVEVAPDLITIHDGIEGGTLAAPTPPVPVCRGYGKKTAWPAFAV